MSNAPERTQHDPSSTSSASLIAHPEQVVENNPFCDLNLSPHDALHHATRTKCPGPCGKQRRYFCCECIIPLIDPPTALPAVRLPLRVHVVQAAAEGPRQSTAQHVALLAAEDAVLWRPFPQCGPDVYDGVVKGADDGTVAVLYPGDDALSPADAATQLPNLRHLIVLDATWTKSTTLMQQTPWLQNLPRVTLPPGVTSRFWRYAPVRGDHSQHFSRDKVASLVSTVEAVHRFCDAFAVARGGRKGCCDDLLWLFAFVHGRVREVYERNPGKRGRILRKSKGLLDQF